MSSLEPDQHQAQVPDDVEEASRPHVQAMTSTSGAAYELETSGDGEARQMAASNDDTADLFGSPLPLTGDGLQVSQTTSSGSELSEQAMGDLDNDNQGLGGTGTAEDGAGGTIGVAAPTEEIDGSTPANMAESAARTTDRGSEVVKGAVEVPTEAVQDIGRRAGDEDIEVGAQVKPAGSSDSAGAEPGRRLAQVIMGSAGAGPGPNSSDDEMMDCHDHTGAALGGFSPVGVGRTASGHRSLL